MSSARPATGFHIELVLECRDAAVAKALNDVLMPDNRYFPKDQKFKGSEKGANIRFDVSSPRARPALSTASSLISDAMLFRDVWVEAKTRGLASAAPT
ncbi:MAG: hypothetical protein ACRD6W_12190 [Nitrososphaerales archaeon]